MTLPDGCLARARRGRRPARCTARPWSRSSRSRRSASGDAFLAGFVAARYGGRDAEDVPALRGGLRGRVDAALRRRRRSSSARSSGCSPEVARWSALETPAVSAKGVALGPLLRSGFRPPSNLGSPPMEVEIGRGKKGRRAYGFDDIAIVPSRRTRDPDDIDITWTLGPYRFELPLLASAMDGVVSPATAGHLGKLGGLAVLNLEGIWTRYEDAGRRARADRRLPARSRPPPRCSASTRSRSRRS